MQINSKPSKSFTAETPNRIDKVLMEIRYSKKSLITELLNKFDKMFLKQKSLQKPIKKQNIYTKRLRGGERRGAYKGFFFCYNKIIEFNCIFII